MNMENSNNKDETNSSNEVEKTYPTYNTTNKAKIPFKQDSQEMESKLNQESSSLDGSQDALFSETDIKSKNVDNKKNRSRRFKYMLLGLLLIVIVTALGGFLGYQSGIQRRLAENSSQIALVAATQYQLGLTDIEEGRYEMARKRFEYIIQLDPNFPGVSQKLTEVMLVIAMESAPTQAMTAAVLITPTVDNRGAEELFQQAQLLIQNKDWNGSIDILGRLRMLDYKYRAIEVDGLYYIVLRFSGMEKILKLGDLEGGIYDLTLAERFAPLDKEADDYRSWSRQYITGASFWGIDWGSVVNYFALVYPSLPNLRDSSNMTAAERFRIASVHYGQQLVNSEDWCGAEYQYQTALSFGSDASIEPQATSVAFKCHPPDTDGDGITDDVDRCIDTPNTGNDTNGDGIDDACDPDIDGDGWDNGVDNCPYIRNEQVDSNGDGKGDACQT